MARYAGPVTPPTYDANHEPLDEKRVSPDLVLLDVKALTAIDAEKLATLQEVVKCLSSKVITPDNAREAAEILVLALGKLGILVPTTESEVHSRAAFRLFRNVTPAMPPGDYKLSPYGPSTTVPGTTWKEAIAQTGSASTPF